MLSVHEGFSVFSLFPTPVGKFELGRNLTEQERLAIASRPFKPNIGNWSSTDSNLLSSPDLLDINKFITESLDRYLQVVYAPAKDVSLRVTQSWANLSNEGQYHHNHKHVNSFVSGVFYVIADKSIDKINFYKDSYKQIKLHTNSPNGSSIYSDETTSISVHEGDLLIFPSDLSHAVDYVESKHRISLSFNTFPIGRIGEKERLTELYLSELPAI